jgi:hypothetical protein
LVGGKNSEIINFGIINATLTDATFRTGEFRDPLDPGEIPSPGESRTDQNQIGGMYIDTKSRAYNYGIIDGVATINGRLVGMQARVINEELFPVDPTPMILLNEGFIELKVTAENSTNLRTNLVGMGSFLDLTFLEGKSRFSRAAFTEIANFGDIHMWATIVDESYDPNNSYSAAPDQKVIEGNHGIVGMRADFRATATNHGNIIMNNNIMYPRSPEKGLDEDPAYMIGAGMLAVRGGIIFNAGYIEVNGGAVNYGMLGVRGTGINAEIDLQRPWIENHGEIVVNTDGGVGMGSRYGGVIINNGTIINNLGGSSVEMHLGAAFNNGDISVRSGSSGMSVNTGTVVNSATGTINVSCERSSGMMVDGRLGLARNEGTINVSADATGMLVNEDGTVINLANINIISGESIGMKAIGKDEGSAFAENRGIINILSASSTGMFSETGGRTSNAGTINVSAAQATGMFLEDEGVIINDSAGVIIVNGSTASGMASSASGEAVISNRGTIDVTNGYGIYVYENASGVTVRNSGVINVTSGFGIYDLAGSQIFNSGAINLLGNGATGIFSMVQT